MTGMVYEYFKIIDLKKEQINQRLIEMDAIIDDYAELRRMLDANREDMQVIDFCMSKIEEVRKTCLTQI